MSRRIHQPDAADGRSVGSRVFGVVGRRETDSNLAYLLVGLPVGIAYYAALVTGVSLGVGLLPVVVGVPILAATVGAAGYVGVIDAELLGRVRGHQVSYGPTDPFDSSVVGYLKTTVTAPRSYLLFVFGLASFVVGLPVSTTVVTVLALGVSLVVAPLLYWIPGVNYESTTAETVEVRPVTVDGLTTLGVGGSPEVIVASLVGVVVLVAGLHGVNLTARLFEAATVRLPGETTA